MENPLLPAGRYFDTLTYFQERFDRVGRQLGFKARNLSEYATWKAELRGRLRHITGIDTMVSCPLEPRITERVSMDGYTRERIELQTEPGVIMPVYALIPENVHQQPAEEGLPVVITPHGHGSGGKFSPAGRSDIPAIKSAIERYNYDYAVRLVKQGVIVFAPDARGFGERRERPMQGDSESKFLHQSCSYLNHMAIPLGQTVTGMWVWDLMRLIDYITQRPECDSRRIGCLGLSGGGLQTLWLTALDDRVCAAVVSGYFYGYKEALLQLCENCSCNYVPRLWLLADMGDIGALIAPRPLFIETADGDPLNGPRGVANVIEQVEITRAAYALHGCEDNLVHHMFSCPQHRFSGERAIPTLVQWLKEERNA